MNGNKEMTFTFKSEKESNSSVTPSLFDINKFNFDNSSYSKSEYGIKDYANDSMKQFQIALEKESDINVTSFNTPPDVIQKAQEMIKQTSCVCDLAQDIPVTLKPKMHCEEPPKDSDVCCVVSKCCISMDDICKCLTDASSTNDFHIYPGDVPNQFKICLNNKQGTMHKMDAKKCCTCPHGHCKNKKKLEGKEGEFKVPEKPKKEPPRAFILRRNIYRSFGNFFKDLFAKYTKKFMNLRCSADNKALKMSQYLNDFVDEHFEQHYVSLADESKQEFIIALKQVLFSHRHKKGDIFTKEIDFQSVRGVMYSYSFKARDEFFSCIYRCFLFNFFLEKHKSTFLKKAKKSDTKNLLEEYNKEFGDIEDILKTKSVNQWLS